MTAYSVIDVSNFFIDYYKRSVDPMTVPRVQLFLYFAQAESLARNGRPLFDDEIRAYENGPAVTRIYAYYDGAGNEQISTYRDFDPSVFSKEDYDLLMDVAIFYNQYSTTQLMIMSYAAGGPWEYAYCKGGPTSAMEPSSIRDFFIDQPRIPNHMEFMRAAIDSAGTWNIAALKDATSSSQVYTTSEISGTWE